MEKIPSRLSTKRGLVLVLVYVEDLLIAAQNQDEGETFLQQLQDIRYLENEGDGENPSSEKRDIGIPWTDDLSLQRWRVSTVFL